VRDRVAAERERLDAESRDLDAEASRAHNDRQHARTATDSARHALEAVALTRAHAESTLASHRTERDATAAALLERQRELATLEARLASLEALDANRGTFGDGARFLLAEAGDAFAQHGAVADHLTVERSFERAVDALLGERLQYVIVDRAASVSAALALAEERNAGRCGFVVLGDITGDAPVDHSTVPADARTLRQIARATGPYAAQVAHLIGDALIVDSYAAAQALSRTVQVPVATLAGEVFRGAGIVEGGSRRDARGILETRGEMIALREQAGTAKADVERMTTARAALEAAIAAAESAVAAELDRHHQQEKALVGFDAQVARAEEELARVTRRFDVVSTERRRAGEEEQTAEKRREDASAAIAMHETQQRGAEDRMSEVLASLGRTREEAEGKTRLVTSARADQAGLVERTSALETEAVRLDEAARELEARIAGRRQDIGRHEGRREDLRRSILDTERLLDTDVTALDELKLQVRTLDERVSAERAEFSGREHAIRTARHSHDGVRGEVMRLEVASATAAADLTHLTAACVEAVNLTIEDVVVEVARMEAAGELVAPQRRLAAVSAKDVDEGDDEDATVDAPVTAADDEIPDADARFSPEDAIALLRKRIDRLGPVNMMAIDQFDELESRHTFLTTQRKDLLDSIAQTGEAIKKIDKTTKERFAEAFVQINLHFEVMFTTLFGGGRAGLVLIDQENEQESGIDIIAQPPGKRLQNVQLLSGGEKALTAMALMFAIFKHRPSPFCLLDEIDAPLDDANIGRFVEMLQNLQTNTQFILITHNRKTMEIANRLYGVTMEEPGVSKLISLQVN
jgi:chromosome segregation protein